MGRPPDGCPNRRPPHAVEARPRREFMAKRVQNRRELREQYDAAERQKETAEGEEAEEVEDEEEEGEEEASAGGGGGDDDDDEGGGDDDDEDAPPKPKKKKPAPKPAAKPKSRSRAAKIVRMKMVWKVFNNSNQEIATYDYPK